MNLSKRKVIICKTLLCIISVFQYVFDFNYDIQKIPVGIIVHNSKNSCSPILSSFEQYYVNIDGIKYPRAIPLYLNNSINFDCLNANSPKKKIISNST